MSRPSRPQAPASRSLLLRIVAAVAVLALVGAGIWYWQGRRASASEGAFRTAAVERGNIRVAISSTGTLSATSTVTVGSQISGQVTEILVDFNDRVTQGQVLIELESPDLDARQSIVRREVEILQLQMRRQAGRRSGTGAYRS